MMADLRVDWFRRLCATSDPELPIAMIVAHPDDESVGAGSRLNQFRTALFVYATDGAPRHMQDAQAAGCSTQAEYAAARRAELQAALRLAGIEWDRVSPLGLVDQETPWHLTEFLDGLMQLLRDYRPEIIFTHPYEGGHPDHDATALVAHLAIRLMRRPGGHRPIIIEMASYHNGPGTMVVSTFLPHQNSRVLTINLSEPEQNFKRRMLNCFRTQRRTLSVFPTRFERFRPAPLYDFTQPPHAGRLLYENRNWQICGNQWRRQAANLLGRFRIREPL